MLTVHDIKCDEEYFWEVWERRKTFEIRFNDRNYKVGDTLILRNSKPLVHTGRLIYCKIKYLLKDFIGLTENYVAMSIEVLYRE